MPRAPDLHHAIEAFATHLRVERNLSPRTRDAYVYELQRFRAWACGALGEERLAIPRVGRETLSAYAAHLREDLAYKPTTASRSLSPLRVFFRYCLDEGWIDEDPSRDISNPKLPRKLPVYLSPDEVRRLLAAPGHATAKGRRDHAILVTLACTGIRLQELVGLDTTDIDFSRRTLRVLGKGRKERLVPMNATLAAVLEAHLGDEERRPAHGERAVFLNRRGTRLTGRAVQYIVDECVAAAGITGRKVSPHKLRHSFATMLHNRDVDLVDIQALLGHASLASTQIYTHTDARRLKSVVDRLPADGAGD